jgi:iron complex outermembrane receptor protein
LQAINVNAILNPIFNAAKVTIPGNQRYSLSAGQRQPHQPVGQLRPRPQQNFVTPLGASYNGLNPLCATSWTIGGGVSHDFRLKSGISGARPT